MLNEPLARVVDALLQVGLPVVKELSGLVHTDGMRLELEETAIVR